MSLATVAVQRSRRRWIHVDRRWLKAAARLKLESACLILVGLYALGIRGPLGGDRGGLVVSDLGAMLAALAGSVACVVAARRQTGKERLGWAVFGVAMLSWAIGEVIWSFYELVAHRAAPFPSIADAAYLAAVPLAGTGFLLFTPLRSDGTSWQRTLFDALIVSGSVLLAGWVAVIAPLLEASDEGPLAEVISIAYPLGDIFLFSLVVFVAMRVTNGGRRALLLIGTGLAAYALADAGYAALSLSDAYYSGHPLDVLWFSGYVLMGVGAVRGVRLRQRGSSMPSRLQVLMPFTVAVGALGLGATQQIAHNTVYPVLMLNMFGLVLAVVARQFVLVRDNLRLVIEQSRAVDATKDAIITAASHEFRTPLAIMKGATLTLARKDEVLKPEQRRSLVTMLEENTTRLEVLLQDLLDVNRLSAGVLTVHPQPVDISATARAVVEYADVDGHAFSLPDDPIVVDVDPRHSERILEHLVANAARHSVDGGPVSIRFDVGSDAVVMIVEDTGPGIPEQLRRDIFKPFVRVDPDRPNGGPGMGLAVVAQLAALHGGQAWVEETPDGGSSFRVSLSTSLGSVTGPSRGDA